MFYESLYYKQTLTKICIFSIFGHFLDLSFPVKFLSNTMF